MSSQRASSRTHTSRSGNSLGVQLARIHTKTIVSERDGSEINFLLKKKTFSSRGELHLPVQCRAPRLAGSAQILDIDHVGSNFQISSQRASSRMHTNRSGNSLGVQLARIHTKTIVSERDGPEIDFLLKNINIFIEEGSPEDLNPRDLRQLGFPWNLRFSGYRPFWTKFSKMSSQRASSRTHTNRYGNSLGVQLARIHTKTIVSERDGSEINFLLKKSTFSSSRELDLPVQC